MPLNLLLVLAVVVADDAVTIRVGGGGVAVLPRWQRQRWCLWCCDDTSSGLGFIGFIGPIGFIGFRVYGV